MITKNSLVSRLARVALIALVRGSATAVGAGLVSLVIWWVTR
ncbi:hypothetical protein [Actinomadura madurae]|nr:hypothetical protein [Actinomadura madurae]SPT59209.1 Uncharacterised protein [Actinomadura madurae]